MQARMANPAPALASLIQLEGNTAVAVTCWPAIS